MTARYVFVLLVLLAGVPLAYSKGPPDLILISGGGLDQPVEITDPASLERRRAALAKARQVLAEKRAAGKAAQ